jgi:hypothetical protein
MSEGQIAEYPIVSRTQIWPHFFLRGYWGF